MQQSIGDLWFLMKNVDLGSCCLALRTGAQTGLVRKLID
jgi:hypothetical protein